MAQMFFGPNFDAEEEWRQLDGRVADEDPMWGPAEWEMGKERSIFLIPHSRTTVLKFTLEYVSSSFLWLFFLVTRRCGTHRPGHGRRGLRLDHVGRR